MKYTQEQLATMSDYEINCAVAEKKGYLVESEIQTGIGLTESFMEQYPNTIWSQKSPTEPMEQFCFTATPDEYMPIAIDNEIDIDHDCGRVYCTWGKNSAQETTRYMQKEDVGRAVCEAFLMSVTVTGEDKYK